MYVYLCTPSTSTIFSATRSWIAIVFALGALVDPLEVSSAAAGEVADTGSEASQCSVAILINHFGLL